jgi:hypothetical protein
MTKADMTDEIEGIAVFRARVPFPSQARLGAGRERLLAAMLSGQGHPDVAHPARWRRRPVLAAGLTVAAAAAAGAAAALAIGAGAVTAQHGPAGHARTVVTAAWTVRKDADGIVTVYLKRAVNVQPVNKFSLQQALLEQTLKADGVNAIVRQVPVVWHKSPRRTITLGDGSTVVLPDATETQTCYYINANEAPRAVQKAVVVRDNLSAAFGGFAIRPKAMPPGSALFIWFVNFGGPNGGFEIQSPIVLNNDTLPPCVPASQLPRPVSRPGSPSRHPPAGWHTVAPKSR